MAERMVAYCWLEPGAAGDRLAEARERAEAYAAAAGRTLDAFVVERSAPGPALGRPELQAILAEPETTLLLPSLADLGRRFHDVATVMFAALDAKCRVVAIAEDLDTARPDTQQLLRLFATIPQLAPFMRTPPVEASRVFVRSREVLHNGGTCPYGYALDEGTNQFKQLPREAAVVRRIFHEREAGRSLRQIAGDLTRDEIPTKRGGRWQANTVKTILENVFYTGAYQCQNRVYHDDHEPIVSEELFRRVNGATEITQIVAG